MAAPSDRPHQHPFDSSRFVDNLLSDEEVEVLQFLSDPDHSVDDLSDEELSQYIDAVGGPGRWMDLQKMAFSPVSIVPDSSSNIRDELELKAEQLSSQIKRADDSAVKVTKVDALDEASAKVSPADRGWQTLIRYATVALTASAATLLLVASFSRNYSGSDSGVGWTTQTVDAAVQTSQAASNFRASKLNTYQQLARNLSDLESSLFQDTDELSEGLKELYRSCHKLRLEIDRFQLDKPDKEWLRGQCDVWADLTLRKLSELNDKGSDSAELLLRSSQLQLSEMRRQLNNSNNNSPRG